MVSEVGCLMTMKSTHFKMSSQFCVGICIIIMLILSSIQGEQHTVKADFIDKNKQLSENKTQSMIQDSQTNTLKPVMFKSFKPQLHSTLVKIRKFSHTQQTDQSFVLRKVSMKEPMMNSNGSNVEAHIKDGKLDSARAHKDLKIRKVRSLQTPQSLPHTNQTTLAPMSASVENGIISPTPVLTALKSDQADGYESPHEVQDDKNEDMLNLLNARGFSYTALPDDMMSRYPDIVQQVDAQEMETNETEHEGDAAEGEDGEGQGSDGPENEANENEGNDQEGNEAGEQDNEEEGKKKPETPESASSNDTESESHGLNSEHGEKSELQHGEHLESEVEHGKHELKSEHGKYSESEHLVSNTGDGKHMVSDVGRGKHWDTELESSMTELPGKTTEQYYSQDSFDYQPYYPQLDPGQTAIPRMQSEMPQLHNGNSRQKPTSNSNQRHELQNAQTGNSDQKPTSKSKQNDQLHNTGNPNSKQNPTVASYQKHQLHNIASTNPGQTPTAGSQGQILNNASTPTKTKTVNTGLSASTIFGIVAGCLIGSWMVLGPMICLICKYRDSHREKKRFNKRVHQSDCNNGITEAMIMSELGKEPLKLNHGNLKGQQRESTYSDKSETFHDAFETPSLLL